MSIFVEDNEFASEVKGQLELIAHPLRCGLRPMFLPSSGLAGGAAVSTNYFRVDYPTATHPSDLGAKLLNRLANYLPKHVFIHGVPNNWYVLIRRESLSVRERGGGITTDEISYPHVDLFVDGSKDNKNYEIRAKGLGTIRERNPFVRLYHELLHAEGLIFGQDHGHSTTVFPKTNDFCRQRNLGYERVLPLGG